MRYLIALLCAVFLSAASASAAEYMIDTEHSKVMFKVKHLGISSVSGHFGEFSGSFHYDPKNVKGSKTEATITAKSIDTDHKKRDAHLTDADFLNVTKFPMLTFKSTGVDKVMMEEDGSGGFKLKGDLTLAGVTKPVVLDVEVGGMAKDPWGNERAAFVATTKLNRKDYGLTWNKVLETGGLLVGEDVKIEIEIEGIKKKQA